MEQRVSKITPEHIGQWVKQVGWSQGVWGKVSAVGKYHFLLVYNNDEGSEEAKMNLEKSECWIIRDPQSEKLPSERLKERIEEIAAGEYLGEYSGEYSHSILELIGQILDEIWRRSK